MSQNLFLHLGEAWGSWSSPCSCWWRCSWPAPAPGNQAHWWTSACLEAGGRGYHSVSLQLSYTWPHPQTQWGPSQCPSATGDRTCKHSVRRKRQELFSKIEKFRVKIQIESIIKYNSGCCFYRKQALVLGKPAEEVCSKMTQKSNKKW